MRASVLTALALAAGTALATPALAVELTLGAGAALAPDYEGSDDYVGVPLWNIRAGNLYGEDTFVQVLGTSLSSNFLPDAHWRLGAAGLYKFDYNNVDNRRVQDVKGTNAAMLLGPTVGYDFLPDREADLAVELDALYDVLNGKGGVVTPRVRGRTVLAPGLIGEARVSTTWGSADYMGNWFSINNRDSERSGLDSYDADEGFKDVAIGGSMTYRFAERWALVGFAAYSRLLGDAADSPIVDDEGDANQFVTGALVNYTF
ncbi:MAG: MipA/OmpV family protein [Geminicoccaceae bacterium]